MELNLALSATHNRHCTVSDGSGQVHRQLLEGFNPRVELKETRSSYSLNVHLPGFRREDIRLEMDNTRTLLIRGQTCLEGLGIVSWTWHLMERSAGRRNLRRPFKIPHNVNVPSMTGSFHHGVLHVQMPKLRLNRFSPYHINGSTRNRHYYDPPTMQRPGRASIRDRAVQFPDELMAPANELAGDHVTDHSDSQRLPHCPAEEEDECTILTEQSVDLHVPEGSSADILSSQEEDSEHDDPKSLVEEDSEHGDPKSLVEEDSEHGDPKSLVEEMKEAASTLSQNPQDQQQQQPELPPVKLCSDSQPKEEELGEIMEEEDIEHPTADPEGKALKEADCAGNSHPINSIKPILEEQRAMRPLNSEDEEESSGEKLIPPNSMDMICDFQPMRIFSKTNTKILLSVILSAAALVAARKLLRRL